MSTAVLALLSSFALPQPAQDPAEYQRLFAEGQQAYEEGRLERSIECYEQVLEFFPDASACAYNIACSYALLDEPEAALQWLDSAVDRSWGRFVGEADQIITDADLAGLRGQPRFEDIHDRAERHWHISASAMVAAAERRVASGRADLALGWLERAVDTGWGTGPRDGEVLRSPAFAPLGEEQSLADRYGAVLARADARREEVLASTVLAPREIEWERGHRDLLVATDAHPSAPRFLTAGRDRTIRVWDAETREELATLRGHLDSVLAASFGPEGERILSASRDTTARVWDARSGENLLVIPCGGIVQDARFSPDGARAVTAGLESRLAHVWDASTGAELAVLAGHTRGVWTACFDPEGRRVLSGGRDGTVRVHDAASGELLQTWDVSWHPTDPATVRGLAFSPADGRVLTTSWDGACRLHDPGTGATVLEFRKDGLQWLSSAFDPSGEWVVSSTASGGAVVWEAASGRALRELGGHDGWVMDVAVDAAGRTAVSAGWDGHSMIWDLERGARLGLIAGRRPAVTTARIAPDGSQVVVLSEHDTRAFELEQGAQVEPAGRAPRGAFGTASYAGNLWRSPAAFEWSAREASVLVLPEAKEVVFAVAAPDRERLYTVDLAGRGHLWAADGSQVRELGTHVPRSPDEPWENEYQHARFSRDGSLLLTVLHGDHVARVWSAADGVAVAELVGHTGEVLGGSFDASAARVATASRDRTVRVWSVADSACALVLAEQARQMTCAAFDDAGERIATAGFDTAIRLWDARTGELQAVLRGHRRPVVDVSFGPGGRRLVSTSTDETARVWDVDQQRLVATFVVGGEGGWLTFTPEHFFAGSAEALESAVMVLNGEPFPLRCFEAKLARSERVRDSLAGVRGAPANVLRPPSLVVLDPVRREHVARGRDVRLRVRAADSIVGIEGIQIVQDGRPWGQSELRGAVGELPGDPVADFFLDIRIPEGVDATRLALRAVNSRGITSRDWKLDLRFEPPTEDLYLLAIGVSDYERDDLDLSAPVKDVEDIVAFFRAQEGGLYQNVHVRALVDGQVDAGALHEARERFLLAAEDDDTIVVFVAGHGVLSELGDYWFLAPGATPERPYAGVPRRDLEALVAWQRLHARRRVMFLDTCHAGATVAGSRGAGISDFLDGQRASDLAAGSQGLYILSASADREFAREQEDNGVFTRALLDGLGGAADQGPDGNGDDYVQVEELLPFVRDRVLELSAGAQSPEYSRVEGGGNFRLSRP